MSDKRKVHTDALDTLGTIIDESAKRDAIHLAVEPCVAAEVLYPGQHVGIVAGKGSGKADKKLGIVDPFLTGPVPVGAMFWLVVFPRQITSLRHVWSHPDFPESGDKFEILRTDSVEYLHRFAEENGVEYDKLLYHAEEGWIPGDTNGISVPDEFWVHWQIVTGREARNKYSYFSCSC